MVDYGDPKVTTPTEASSSSRKWIAISVAVVLAFLLLGWLIGAYTRDEIETTRVETEEPAPDPVVTEQPATGTGTPPVSPPASPAVPTTQPLAPAN